MTRYAQHKRELVEPDFLVLAADHWNFNVRGFNPGGNHGSFLRISTHSTLLFACGAEASIPQRRVIDEPYDSLAFVPTIWTLLGRPQDAAGLPGPVIQELLHGRPVVRK